MKTFSIRGCAGVLCAGMLALAFAACDATQPSKTETPKLTTPTTTTPPRTTATPTTPAVTPVRPTTPAVTPATAFKPLYIKAGSDAAITDPKGIKWDVDTNYAEGGSTIDRPELNVTGTDNPAIYKSERYSMDNFHIKVPNGKYILKLHFSEDYDGIGGPGDRLFTYTVKDGTATAGKVVKEVKDFGPWKASGAEYKAQVETINITVTNEMITIVFTPQVENPQINAIEVLPG